MKIRYISITIFLILLLVKIPAFAQQFNGVWSCNYATIDDQPNSIGSRCIDVGVIKENSFVALTYSTSSGANYLVGYTNADSINGRMGYYDYGTGMHQHWMSGFDDLEMTGAASLAATPDSLIYVANNDPLRNILVFKLSQDSVISTDYRISTGSDSIWAVTVDGNGIVYVTVYKGIGFPAKILVFNSIAKDDNWAGLHTPTPLTTITLPDTGICRGIATNSDGSVIYVSNYRTEKIYCYTGGPAAGYTLYNGFNFTLTDTPKATDGTALNPGPWGLSFINSKNILLVACANNFQTGIGYEYGRIYALNPNTGSVLDTLDCAKWNYDQTGSYNNRTGGTASGYASPYNVAYDENFHLYIQSNYGWTVDKWTFSGTLPTIPMTITGIKELAGNVPDHFNLLQNYPNPFNPSTTISYSVLKESDVTILIFNSIGQYVKTLVKEKQAAGNYSINFEGTQLASGIYFYSFTADPADGSMGYKQTKKMILLK